MKRFITDPLVIILNIIWIVCCLIYWYKGWENNPSSYLIDASTKQTSIIYAVGLIIWNFILFRMSDPNYDIKKSPMMYCDKCGSKLNGIRGLGVKKCHNCGTDFE